MSEKVILLKDYKKYKKFNKNVKMFFLVIIFGAAAGFVSWHVFVDSMEGKEIKIPESKNITYNDKVPVGLTTTQVANQFEQYENKPILLYIYTTWCRTCGKNFPIINEVIREFQNTDLEVIAIAIDRDITPEYLTAYLEKFGDFYFEPQYLSFKEGFLSLLKEKGVNYSNKIPFTALIARDGEVVMKFSGSKNKNYLRKKIIKTLF